MPRNQDNLRAWKKANRAKDVEAAREADRARYARDRERILARQQSYREADPEKNRKRSAEWYEAHKDDPEFKALHKQRADDWKNNNREKYLAARKRRYEKLKQDPERHAKFKADAARRNRERRGRLKEVADAAKSSGCCECGEKKLLCLDFHHRDPATKVRSIGKELAHFSSLDELRAEIAKCDVICANCHKKHHDLHDPPRPRRARKSETSARQRALREERWGHTIAQAKRKGCTLCSEDDHACLQFHHVDPTAKAFKIGDYKLFPLKTDLWLEIQKCMVLCVNCHRRVHAGIAVLPGVSLEAYWSARLSV